MDWFVEGSLQTAVSSVVSQEWLFSCSSMIYKAICLFVQAYLQLYRMAIVANWLQMDVRKRSFKTVLAQANGMIWIWMDILIYFLQFLYLSTVVHSLMHPNKHCPDCPHTAPRDLRENQVLQSWSHLQCGPHRSSSHVSSMVHWGVESQGGTPTLKLPFFSFTQERASSTSSQPITLVWKALVTLAQTETVNLFRLEGRWRRHKDLENLFAFALWWARLWLGNQLEVNSWAPPELHMTSYDTMWQTCESRTMQQGHDMSWNLRCLGKWFIFHVIFVPQLRSTPRLPKPRRNKSLQSFIINIHDLFLLFNYSVIQSAIFSANYSPSYRMISVSVSSSPAFPTSLWNRPRGNCHDCLLRMPITSRVCTKHYWGLMMADDGWWWLIES